MPPQTGHCRWSHSGNGALQQRAGANWGQNGRRPKDQRLTATVCSLLPVQAAASQNPQGPGEEEMSHQAGTMFLPKADLV